MRDAGGGGAGGFRTGNFDVSAISYTVVVGAGAVARTRGAGLIPNLQGLDGSPSSAFGISSTGGGGGGGYTTNGRFGGSGGGGGQGRQGGGSVAGEGNNGGPGTGGSSNFAGGGGGGLGSAGFARSQVASFSPDGGATTLGGDIGGNGGIGATSNIRGI